MYINMPACLHTCMQAAGSAEQPVSCLGSHAAACSHAAAARRRGPAGCSALLAARRSWLLAGRHVYYCVSRVMYVYIMYPSALRQQAGSWAGPAWFWLGGEQVTMNYT